MSTTVYTSTSTYTIGPAPIGLVSGFAGIGGPGSTVGGVSKLIPYRLQMNQKYAWLKLLPLIVKHGKSSFLLMPPWSIILNLLFTITIYCNFIQFNIKYFILTLKASAARASSHHPFE